MHQDAAQFAIRHFGQNLTLFHMFILHEGIHTQHRADRHLVQFEVLQVLRLRQSAHEIPNQFVQLLDVRDTGRIGGEAWVINQMATTDRLHDARGHSLR